MSNTHPFALRRACKPGLYAAATLTALTFVSSAQAQITQITSSQLSAGSTVVPYTGTAGAILPNPYVLTASATQTLTFTNNSNAANNNSFLRTDQQGFGSTGNFGGDFASGTTLLRSAGSGSGAVSAVTLTFSSAVSQLGFSFEPTVAGSANEATFTFVVFEGAASTTFTTPTPVRNRGGNGTPAPTPAFFGVNDAAGNRITSLQIYATAANVNATPDDFVLAPVSVTVAAVPEPGVLALLAGASLPLGLLAARRRR